MKNLNIFLLAVSFFAFLGLAGCSGFGVASFPDASVNPSQTPIGTISGTNYGGHAPLAGSHIYLVEPGNTGYGSPVKSLITATGSNVTQNGNWTNAGHPTDQFVPATAYGILADANSAYTLTGDYTCDVGRPVWVIGYGGSPSFPALSPAIAMATSSSTSSLDTVESDGTNALFTFTTASTENFYIGEGVAVSNFGNGSTGFNISGSVADPGNASQTVTTGGTTYTPILTTTQFSVYQPTTLAAGTYTVTAQSGVTPTPQVVASPVFNPAAVNVASLGVCPSGGTLAGSISYIYMNEVSTTAWAYAFNQFGNYSVNDQSGNNEFNVGAPATTQAQQALINAAYAAENLYDIQGGNLSTSYAGEGHIARAQTPSGGGIVPQAELDTIANILAACVDSNNTYRLQAGIVSPQCNTLETYATDNGVYDSTTTVLTATQSHVSFNIAQAAMNIAHYPQGAGTGTSNNGVQTITSAGTATTAANFVKALYSLPTGNVPFSPNLLSTGVGQPNDFSIGISWQTSPYATSGTPPANPFNNSTTNTGSTTNLVSVGETAIDALGNAWFLDNTSTTNSLRKLTPAGYYSKYTSTYFTGIGTDNISGLAIDTSGNLFVSATAGVDEFSPSNNYGFQSAGAVGYVSGNGPVTQNSGEVAVDNSGYLVVANLNQPNPPTSNSGSTSSQLVKIAAVPGTLTTNFTVTGGGTNNTASQCANNIGYVTLDRNNNIWTTSQAFSGTSPVCLFNSSGVLQYSYTGLQFPHMVAIDKAGNAWVGDKQSNTLNEFPVGSTSASGVQGAAPNVFTASANNTGAISAPRAVAVDGANTIWITNGTSGGITQVSDAGVLMSPTFYTGSGFNAIAGQGAAATSATFMTIDPSGNLWATDTGHGQIVEWIGIAAPTVQPLAAQRAGTVANNGHGTGQLP